MFVNVSSRDAGNSHHSSKKSDNNSVTYPSRTVVHPKLEMTEPGDADEREADAAAHDVMSGKVFRKFSGGGAGGGMAVSSQMESQLNQLQGGGQAMPDGLRGMMERGFDRDFSQVRLHTDGEAAGLSSSIHAKAFTHGNDIYFNQGQYAPETSEGQRLVAHELAHVAQGGGKVGRIPWGGYYFPIPVSKPSGPSYNPDVHLLFNGITLSIFHKNEKVDEFPAFSGKAAVKDNPYEGCFSYTKEKQMMKRVNPTDEGGPAPEGRYLLFTKDIATRHWYSRNFSETKRVQIHPQFSTNRTGLNIHGGYIPGSSGCIDLVYNDEAFFSELLKYAGEDSIVRLKVDYSNMGNLEHCIPWKTDEKFKEEYHRGKVAREVDDDTTKSEFSFFWRYDLSVAEDVAACELPFLGIDNPNSLGCYASNFQVNICNGVESLDCKPKAGTANEGDSGNAYRHALWQAMIYSVYGEKTAIDAGSAHESGKTMANNDCFLTKRAADVECDLRNNVIGRNIAAKNKNKSNKELAKLVLAEFHDNGLYVAVFEKFVCGYRVKIKKLTDAEYQQALDIVEKKGDNGLNLPNGAP